MMQSELRTLRPELNIEIVGINRISAAAYSEQILNALPWLQDTDEQRVWELWDVTWRDVRILNSKNELVGVYNLTQHDLTVQTNYLELRNKLLAASALTDSGNNRLPDDWENYFFKSVNVPTQGDFDQDGRDNFTEYAFGLNPADAKSAIPIQTKWVMKSGQRYLSLEYKRRAGSVLTYTVESSTDLKTWTKLNIGGSVKNLFDGKGVSLASYSIPAPSDPVTRFFRVRATLTKP